MHNIRQTNPDAALVSIGKLRGLGELCTNQSDFGGLGRLYFAGCTSVCTSKLHQCNLTAQCQPLPSPNSPAPRQRRARGTRGCLSSKPNPSARDSKVCSAAPTQPDPIGRCSKESQIGWIRNPDMEAFRWVPSFKSRHFQRMQSLKHEAHKTHHFERPSTQTNYLPVSKREPQTVNGPKGSRFAPKRLQSCLNSWASARRAAGSPGPGALALRSRGVFGGFPFLEFPFHTRAGQK